MDEKPKNHLINIFYLPIDSRLHYLIGHILFRSQKNGCHETNQSLSEIFSKSHETIKKDISILKNEKWIVIKNPGMPGKRILLPSKKLKEFLARNTQEIIEDNRVKYYHLNNEDGKILPPKRGESYHLEGKILPPRGEDLPPHNSNVIKEINKRKKLSFTSNLRFDNSPPFLIEFYKKYPLGEIIILEQLLAMFNSKRPPKTTNDNHLSKTFNKWLNKYKGRRIEFEPGLDPYWIRLESWNFEVGENQIRSMFWIFWTTCEPENQTDQYSINEAFHYFLVNEKKLKPKYDLPLREN